MRHKSDLITRKGLERIREYCKKTQCSDCIISDYCDELNYWLISLNLPEIDNWTDPDIHKILKATRNYMEATFIKSLEKIVEQDGKCLGVSCNECPLSKKYNEEYLSCVFIADIVREEKNVALVEMSKMLLDYYKGERN